MVTPPSLWSQHAAYVELGSPVPSRHVAAEAAPSRFSVSCRELAGAWPSFM